MDDCAIVRFHQPWTGFGLPGLLSRARTRHIIHSPRHSRGEKVASSSEIENPLAFTDGQKVRQTVGVRVASEACTDGREAKGVTVGVASAVNTDGRETNGVTVQRHALTDERQA